MQSLIGFMISVKFVQQTFTLECYSFTVCLVELYFFFHIIYICIDWNCKAGLIHFVTYTVMIR